MAFGAVSDSDCCAIGHGDSDNAIAPNAVFAPSPAILNDIHRQAVALAVWHREPPLLIPGGDLLGYSGIRFEAAIDHVAACLTAELERQARKPWHDPVADDAADLARLFATIMGCSRVEIRLEPISTDACRKFHADCVTCRLITTYLGQATQWVPAAEMAGPIRQLSAGDVALFKGDLWMPERPILHRSPPIAGTGEIRLLLVINPGD